MSIPGLSLCPVDSEGGNGIDIPSFNGTVNIPESHRYGNCKKVQEYEKLSKIHEGSYGAIYKCLETKSNQIYALKRFQITSNWKGGFPLAVIREISILKALNHKHIVNAHETVVGKLLLENNFLVLDYCIFSVEDLINKGVKAVYQREVVKKIMKQLFKGLKYLHDNLVIHRDISCRNLLFTEDGILKISGFRTVRYHSTGNMTPGVTEVIYRAPELLYNSKKYDFAVDVWSAGCVFAKLLLKKPLFTGNSELEVLKSIFTILGSPSEEIWPGFNDEIHVNLDPKNSVIEYVPYSELKNTFTDQTISSAELCQMIFVYYPKVRPSAAECLRSSYFTEAPRACSRGFIATILQKVMSAQEAMEMDD